VISLVILELLLISWLGLVRLDFLEVEEVCSMEEVVVGYLLGSQVVVAASKEREVVVAVALKEREAQEGFRLLLAVLRVL